MPSASFVGVLPQRDLKGEPPGLKRLHPSSPSGHLHWPRGQCDRLANPPDMCWVRRVGLIGPIRARVA